MPQKSTADYKKRTVKKPEERKQELLDIALQLFLHNGYENTSVRDIYTKAGGSFGMFYHHFKSKQEIYKAVVVKFAALFIEKLKCILLDKKISFKKRYAALIQYYIVFLEECDKMDSQGGELNVAMFREANLKMVSESIRPIRLFIEEGVEKGLLRVKNIPMAATFLTYGVWGTIYEEVKRLSSNKNAPSLLAKLSGFIAKITGADETLFRIKTRHKK
jgi:AcrR family transcriptional regulator